MSDAPYDRRLGTLRLVAVYVFVAILIYFARPHPAVVTVGFVVAGLGEALRLWAAGHLLKTRELVTSGPYRYTRNPLYLGRLLILTGIGIAGRLPYFLNTALLVAGYAIFFGYYLPRKERVEPARLREAHGDPYDRYFRAVPALVPRLTPYDAGSSAGWSSDRMIRNKEHWMVVGVIAIFLLLLFKAYWPDAPISLKNT